MTSWCRRKSPKQDNTYFCGQNGTCRGRGTPSAPPRVPPLPPRWRITAFSSRLAPWRAASRLPRHLLPARGSSGGRSQRRPALGCQRLLLPQGSNFGSTIGGVKLTAYLFIYVCIYYLIIFLCKSSSSSRSQRRPALGCQRHLLPKGSNFGSTIGGVKLAAYLLIYLCIYYLIIFLCKSSCSSRSPRRLAPGCQRHLLPPRSIYSSRSLRHLAPGCQRLLMPPGSSCSSRSPRHFPVPPAAPLQHR